MEGNGWIWEELGEGGEMIKMYSVLKELIKTLPENPLTINHRPGHVAGLAEHLLHVQEASV